MLRGQAVPVETVWTAEVPRSPEDFSVDVRLSNGMTVVVNNRRELDGRWFVVAKDSSSKGHLLARFQRREPSGLGLVRQAVAVLGGHVPTLPLPLPLPLPLFLSLKLPPTMPLPLNLTLTLLLTPTPTPNQVLGSPFSSDVSTLLVLLFAVLITITLSPAEYGPEVGEVGGRAGVLVLGNQTALEGAGRAVGYWLRVALATARGPPQWLEPAGAARVAGWLEPALVQAVTVTGRYGGDALLRMLLLLALCFAFVGRLAGKLSAAFPARCSHAIVIKPGSSADLQSLLGVAGGGLAAPSGARVSDGHSVVFKLTQLWHRAITLPGGGHQRADGNGGEGHRPGRTEGGGGGGGGGDGEGEGGGQEGGGGREGREESSGIVISMAGFFLACSSMHTASEALGPFISLANKNDEGNLRKLRKAWDALERTEATRGGGDRCATLRGLLELERDSGIHGRGGVLADPSAAMAILWLRRSMDFMADLQVNIGALDEGGGKQGSSRRAAFDAYAEHLEPFHNWLLKHTFRVALNAIPSKREFLQRLGPLVAEEVTASELRDHAEVVKQITEALRVLFCELDLEDTRKV